MNSKGSVSINYTSSTANNSSSMSINEISSPQKAKNDEKHTQILEKIKVIKNDISILSSKTDAYSKNTGSSYKDYVSPKKEAKNSPAKSPLSRKSEDF